MTSYREYRNGGALRGKKRAGALRRLIPLALVALFLALLWFNPFSKDSVQGGIAGFGNSERGHDDSSDPVVAGSRSSSGSGMDESTGEASGGVSYAEDGSSSLDDVIVINRMSGLSGEANESAESSFDASRGQGASTGAPVEGGGLGGPNVGSDSGYCADATEGRPESGFVFESRGEGRFPQLIVTAPEDADAFVKLRDSDTGKTALSFYVRAGTAVQACVPLGVYELSYWLGADWQGTENYFGAETVYRKCPVELDFRKPTNRYKYSLRVEDFNVIPIPIEESEFYS